MHEFGRMRELVQLAKKKKNREFGTILGTVFFLGVLGIYAQNELMHQLVW